MPIPEQRQPRNRLRPLARAKLAKTARKAKGGEPEAHKDPETHETVVEKVKDVVKKATGKGKSQ
jgi:hypothetical protein